MTSKNRRHHSEELYFHAINQQALEKLGKYRTAEAGALAAQVEKTIEHAAGGNSDNKFVQVIRLALGLQRAQAK